MYIPYSTSEICCLGQGVNELHNHFEDVYVIYMGVFVHFSSSGTIALFHHDTSFSFLYLVNFVILLEVFQQWCVENLV